MLYYLFFFLTNFISDDLCNDAALKQPEDGDIESVTVAKAMCNTAYYQSWCDDGPRNIYTLQRGVVLHTEVINGDAFGMLLTGIIIIILILLLL